MSSQFAASIPCGSRALIRWTLAALTITLAALVAMVCSAATARGQETPDAVDTVTEAENILREAERAPDETQRLFAPADRADSAPPAQPLAPPTTEQGTTAAAMTAPPARIDFRRFGVKFKDAGASTQPTPADQAPPGGLTVDKVRMPSAASQLGLTAGDQIVSVSGIPVTTAGQIGQSIEKALSTGPHEDHVTIPLVMLRAGAEQTLTISNAELAIAGYGPLLTEFGHYVPPQYVTGYRGASNDPHIPANPSGAYLGVELNSQFRSAAIVSRVTPGTPAARAGLQVGDRIFAVNNRPVESSNELIYWVSQMQPGDSIEISFERAHDVDVTLDTRTRVLANRQHGASSQFEPIAAQMC